MRGLEMGIRGNTYGSTFFVDVSRNNYVGPVANWGVVETPLKKVLLIRTKSFYGEGTDHERYTP